MISDMPPVQIRRSTLTSPDAARLIIALNSELNAAFPEPGAHHFSLSEAQEAPGDGAFVIAYLEDRPVGAAPFGGWTKPLPNSSECTWTRPSVAAGLDVPLSRPSNRRRGGSA
jgi:hypothetical protein